MQPPLIPCDITPEAVLHALVRRVGAANGISAVDLAHQITGHVCAASQRRLRQVIEQLRLEGHAICATPDAGYHLAANAEDLNRTCAFLVKRMASTARQVAAMKRVAMPDLYGQFGLPIPDDDNKGTDRENEE
jgi:hypothetical protein